ncbi:MAG: tetratricopeptide repeat protein, partial [Spartobacteria bacterium]
LEEAVPSGADWFLPTLVVICDRTGAPIAPPELMEELDQAKIENVLYRILDKTPPPDQLLVPQNEDWVEEDWRAFSAESKINIRFTPAAKAVSEELQAVTSLLVLRNGRPEQATPPPREVAAGLVRTALRLRSPSKKLALLKFALEKSPDCSAARVELADMEFSAGNWKSCGDAYDEIIRRDAELRNQPSTVWWKDHATRPYLRAIYGRAMTNWHLGRFTEACGDLEDLLACNPMDNQGVRFFIPMLHLLAEAPDKAAKFFHRYEQDYPSDFKEPSFIFGWALSCSLESREMEAREKYIEAILRNIYIAPMLLETAEPPKNLWFPHDRAEPAYAADFIQSYAVLWDREPGALRLLREVWQEIQPRIEKIIRQREVMLDLQDQRYDPDF